MSTSSIAPPQPGQFIEGYRLVRELGRGAMGSVWLALDEALQRHVAIKIIGREHGATDEARARFTREAQAMARVRHPNVVEVHAFGEHDGRPYFVMSYVPGATLAQWMERHRGDIPRGDAISILEQIGSGLAAIHRVGAVHLDVKPANVLIGPGLRVAVADLGLARLVGRDAHELGTRRVGTPAYMAPEVARGDMPDESLAPRIDVYSLALVAFELLTGRLPFTAKATPRMLVQHAYALPPRVSEIAPGLGTAFDEPLAAALVKEPRERTASVESLVSALVAAHEATTHRPDALRILIADDHAGCLAATRELLQDALPGVHVHGVSDATAAIEAARAERYDVVLSDLDMPGGGGGALTRALRGDPATENLPIIVTTGYGGAGDWQRLRALGADRFLVKPVEPELLLSAIRRLTDVDGQRD